MKRYLEATVKSDLRKKMVFLVGPRQAGKTTLSHALIASLGAGQYLNCDVRLLPHVANGSGRI